MEFKIAGGDTQSGITMMKWHTHLWAPMLLELKVCHHSVTLIYAAGALRINRYRPRSRWGIIWEPLPSPHTRTLSHTCKLCAFSEVFGFPQLFYSFMHFCICTLSLHLSFVFLFFPLFPPPASASLCLTNILSLGHPLALPLTLLLSISPLHLFLHPFQPSSIYPFCPCSPPPCCTAVQRQISVLVPVRERHGKLHAKTQSANVDKGGGVWTSVHTKHQTHLNHKMKWLTSAELENIFLPSLF